MSFKILRSYYKNIMSGSWMFKLTPSQNLLRDRLFEYSYLQEGELEEYVLLDISDDIEPIAKIFSKSLIGATIDAFDYLSDTIEYTEGSSFWEVIEKLVADGTLEFDTEDEIKDIAEELIDYMMWRNDQERLIITEYLPKVSAYLELI